MSVRELIAAAAEELAALNRTLAALEVEGWQFTHSGSLWGPFLPNGSRVVVERSSVIDGWEVWHPNKRPMVSYYTDWNEALDAAVAHCEGVAP